MNTAPLHGQISRNIPIRSSRCLRLLLLPLTGFLPMALALAGSAPITDLYPIALSQATILDVTPGAILEDIFEGAAPGQFGWLSWSGSPSAAVLAQSLRPPGNCANYVNPDDPQDRDISPGDWVSGKPGVSNSRPVRDALDLLLETDALVPVCDDVRGKGAHTQYHIVAFARIRLLEYRLGGQSRITARFLGLASWNEDNRAPIVDAGSDQTVQWDEPLELIGNAHDDGLPAGADLTFAWSQLEGPGTAVFSAPTEARTFVQFDLPGSYRLLLEVSDSERTGSDELTVAVEKPNRSPSAFSTSFDILEDEAFDILLEGTDPDGDPLSFRISTPPARGTLTGDPPQLRYLPISDFNGSDAFTFIASDGALDSAEATVAIGILPVNDPPVADSQTLTILEDEPVAITLTGADLEATPLDFRVVVGPEHGVLSGTPPDLWYAPTAEFSGADEFQFEVHDGEWASAPATVHISVEPVNDPPVVNAGEDQLIPFSTPLLLCGTASDDGLPDGAGLVSLWEKVDGPGAVTFAPPDALTTQATFDAPGRYRLRLSVTDSEFSAARELEVIVNQSPTADAGPDLIATVGIPIPFRGAITDDNLPTGSVISSWNRLDGPGPAFIARPDALLTETLFTISGEYHFRLTATDGHLCASDDLQVLVRPAGENLPPIVDAGPDRYIALTNEVRMLSQVTDDGLPFEETLVLSWSVVNGPGAVEFVPPNQTNALAQFTVPGVYSLRLTGTDGEFTVSDTVTLSVYPDNQPPVVNAGPDQSGISGPVLLTGNVTDDGLPIDGGLSFRWESINGPGEVKWDTPGQASAHASFSKPGVYELRLTASDSEFEAGDDILITVTGNQPPRVDAGPDQLLDLFVPGVPPPSTTVFPPLPSSWQYSIGQPGLDGDYVGFNCLAASDTTVYVGGAFSTAGGVLVNSLAKWDGCSFSALYDPRPINPQDPNSDPIGFIARNSTETVGARGDELFVSGGFLRDLNQDGSLDFSARWTGTGWEWWAFKIASSSVASRVILTAADAVYFGGQFKFQTSNIPDAPISFNLAKWNGRDWERLGDGIRDIRDTTERNSPQRAIVNALAVAPDSDLYVGGRFVIQTASGLATNLVRWNGADWAPVCPATPTLCPDGTCSSTINAITFGPNGDLFVGGDFSSVGDLNIACVARWDGDQWWPVGDGFNNTVLALTWFENELYAGGYFTRSGTRSLSRLARWDGAQWQPLGNGVTSRVASLAATPSGIYAAGDFTFANGQPSSVHRKMGA